MYKIDTHVHTSEVSPCGMLTAREQVDLYRQAGYSGIVITDHFSDYVYPAAIPWEEKVPLFMSGYRAAEEYAKGTDFAVLFGLEICFSWSRNDYLLYGFDEELLLKYPDLYKMPMEQADKILKRHGCLLIQAHPFRPSMERENPLYLDGVEVYNGNPRHDSQNHKALAFARDNGLLELSGSDAHQTEDVGRGGIITPYPVKDMQSLIGVIKSKKYELITL